MRPAPCVMASWFVAVATACSHPIPPQLFATATLQLEPVEPVTWTEAGDECDHAMPLIPGRPAPYTAQDAAGAMVATCRAQVVPEAQLVQLLHAEAEGEYLKQFAHLCVQGRTRDRAAAQIAYDDAWRAYQEARAESAQLRWVGVGVGVGGVILGTGIGLAAAKVAAL